MRIGISAINGRIGKLLAYEILSNNLFDLTSALARKNSDFIEKDIGLFLGLQKTNTFITDNLKTLVENCDVIIDFSSPELTLKLAEECSKIGKTLISGTNGLKQNEIEYLKELSKNCRIVYSDNISIGINIINNLLKDVVSILREEYDINIIDFSSKFRDNSISNTGLSLINSMSNGNCSKFDKDCKNINDNSETSNDNKINFSTLRGGDKIIEYKILFNSIGEELEFRHNITNNAAFIRGIIRAAIWSDGKCNGFYTMQDVLKLNK